LNQGFFVYDDSLNVNELVDVYCNLGITYLQIGNKSEASKILNLCKEKFYSRLPSSEQDRLIAEAASGGISWKPIFDKQPVSSVGSLAIAPSDPNVI